MPQTHLTDLTLKTLGAPEHGQITYWDDTLSGFGLRVSQGGARTFVLIHGRRRQRTTIGRYPIITLSQARTKAKELLAERTLRKHTLPAITFGEAIDLFLSTHCEQKNKASTARETKRLLQKHFSSLRPEKLEDLAPDVVSRIIDRMLPTPSEANHAFTAVRTFFRWTVRRRYLLHSPLEGMSLPTRPKSKDRVLTDKELGQLWRACEGQFGTLVKLLMLTGQRVGEISALRSEYLNQNTKTITLPAGLTKNGREHAFPYGPAASRLLPKDRHGYLFPARGKDKPMNGFSKCRLALDARAKIAHWTLHDLRRTFATNLAALGVPVHVTEKLLNHVSGTISGVAAIYNRHTYMDEMRAAMKAWEKHLQSLVEQA